jgi:hypothetical protein
MISITCLVEDDDPNDVPKKQEEGVPCGRTKGLAMDGAHDVGVPVDETHEFFQAPEEALAAAHQTLRHGVLLVLLELLVQVLEHQPDASDYGDDARAKRHSSNVIPAKIANDEYELEKITPFPTDSKKQNIRALFVILISKTRVPNAKKRHPECFFLLSSSPKQMEHS